LSGVSDKSVIIVGESESYIMDKDASMEVMEKTMQYDLDGSMNFECELDRTSGWIKKATIRQDFKGEITVVEEDAWNNRSVPVAVKNVITITNKQ